MPEQRIILEMGTGNDLYGEDYTKAACRAVQDALHHSSIVLFQSLGIDHKEMRVDVTIGVQQPDAVDIDVVTRELPRGRAEVTVVHGGLNVHDEDNERTHVVATAAIAAMLDIEHDAWSLCEAPCNDPRP
ncbi:Lin0512 family protein [Cobetia sp. L2A1]|uniref:Lin0512 family protein n=1 Tax=Cobetia sp. L2A1 TaxID=2686360 RepID=UPI00131E582A|nr:Lin0512 family protein [Cobetia sp. L2A1]